MPERTTIERSFTIVIERRAKGSRRWAWSCAEKSYVAGWKTNAAGFAWSRQGAYDKARRALHLYGTLEREEHLIVRETSYTPSPEPSVPDAPRPSLLKEAL